MTSKKRSWIKLCADLSLLFLILIIARPQIGSKLATNKEREGIETIIALDNASNSMLAEDVAPSRLRKSKLLVENLMNKFSE